MSDNKQENDNQEAVADILAEMRGMGNYQRYSGDHAHALADRIEAAYKRERDLIRSCARWILTHDIYGHMSKELLAECKNVLGDDGQFLNK